MENKLTKKNRFIISLCFTAVMGMIIAWEHFYEGGVTTHYLLHSDELPGFSNWLGLAIIPIYTWIISGLIEPKSKNGKTRRMEAFIGFIILCIFGLGMSYAFLEGSDMTLYLTFSLFLFAAVTPLYRAENLLGYILGMLITFGAVIPILFGSLFWLIFYLIHKARTALVRQVKRV